MKYVVIAQVWNSEHEAAEMRPLGWFDRYHDAVLFRDSYSKYYGSTARIHDIMDAIFYQDMNGGELK